jgi:hypothetical protein
MYVCMENGIVKEVDGIDSEQFRTADIGISVI